MVDMGPGGGCKADRWSPPHASGRGGQSGIDTGTYLSGDTQNPHPRCATHPDGAWLPCWARGQQSLLTWTWNFGGMFVCVNGVSGSAITLVTSTLYQAVAPRYAAWQARARRRDQGTRAFRQGRERRPGPIGRTPSSIRELSGSSHTHSRLSTACAHASDGYGTALLQVKAGAEAAR